MSNLQQQIDFGRKLRDEGIQKAVDHANKVHDSWSEDAYRYFQVWLAGKEKGFTFMIEDFREYISGTLADPPHNRAFGSIAVRGKKDGLITKHGHGQVVNPTAHRCFATIWIKL